MSETSSAYDEVLARLVQYLEENLEEKPSGPLGPESRLTADLHLDSIQSFEMVADLEDHYEISIELEQFQTVQSVADVARLVATEVAAKG
jgi:acyl carrier protein